MQANEMHTLNRKGNNKFEHKSDTFNFKSLHENKTGPNRNYSRNRAVGTAEDEVFLERRGLKKT